MKNKIKAYTLLAASLLALSPFTALAEEVSTTGDAPVSITEGAGIGGWGYFTVDDSQDSAVSQEDGSSLQHRPLEDYSFYVGTWQNLAGETITINADGTSSYGTLGKVVDTISNQSYDEFYFETGGVRVVAVPAGSNYKYSNTEDDMTKDRLYLGNGALSATVWYRSSDIESVNSNKEEVKDTDSATSSTEVNEESQVAETSQEEDVSTDSELDQSSDVEGATKEVETAESTPVSVAKSEVVKEEKTKGLARLLPNTGDQVKLTAVLAGTLIVVVAVATFIFKKKS